MKISQSLFVLAVLILSGHLIASTSSPKVIYGDDNRVDVFESSNASFIELAKSTAAMIAEGKIKKVGGGNIEINEKTLVQRGMCAKERFAQQITAANCSGFLVSADVLVTAGHCIKDKQDCKNNKWVFDFKVDHADQGKITLPQSSVFSCDKIIERKLDSVSKDDYAVIKLDRKVRDRSALKFRRSGKPAVGDSIVVIGHPTGLPTKIADGAKIRSLQGKFFMANLDTYGGNSGSAVFNVETEELEGILVRGETDYVYNSTLGCQESNVCSADGCRGEDITYITNIDALKKL